MLNTTTKFQTVSHRYDTNELCDDIGRKSRQKTRREDLNNIKKITQDFVLHSDHIWGESQIDSLLIAKDHIEITVTS